MKKTQLQWLLEIADRRPLLFSIVLLLIAVGYLSTALIRKESEIKDCAEHGEVLHADYTKKVDSINKYYLLRESELNRELKQTLDGIIQEYKAQLEEHRTLNNRMTKVIKNNKKIIKHLK